MPGPSIFICRVSLIKFPTAPGRLGDRRQAWGQERGRQAGGLQTSVPSWPGAKQRQPKLPLMSRVQGAALVLPWVGGDPSALCPLPQGTHAHPQAPGSDSAQPPAGLPLINSDSCSKQRKVCRAAGQIPNSATLQGPGPSYRRSRLGPGGNRAPWRMGPQPLAPPDL